MKYINAMPKAVVTTDATIPSFGMTLTINFSYNKVYVYLKLNSNLFIRKTIDQI